MKMRGQEYLACFDAFGGLGEFSCRRAALRFDAALRLPKIP